MDYIILPVLRLYLDEDMLERVRETVSLYSDKVIRLRKSYSMMETIPLIQDYEAAQDRDQISGKGRCEVREQNIILGRRKS